MNKKNYLILLTETERSMVEESLTQMVNNPFFLIQCDVKTREKEKVTLTKLVETIQSFTGGVRKVMSYDNLEYITRALWWYCDFVPSDKGEARNNDYRKLSGFVRYRNQYKEIFDFNPQDYNPKEKKVIAKRNFEVKRYLKARENDGKINYVTEIIQKEDESFEDYEKRAQSLVETHKLKNQTGNWFLITNENAEKYEYSKDIGYFHQRESY